MKRTIAVLAIAAYAPLASAVYRCVDERGVTLLGDTPPAGCANVPMYEMSRSGQVLRRIEPTPTPEQAKALTEQQAKLKVEQRAAAEQKRKDMALLASFDSPKDFDVARDRNIEPVTSRIAASQNRLKELDAHEKDVNERMEFYKGGRKKRGAATPAEDPNLVYFREELARIRSERANLTEGVARLHREIDDITQRFEADKRRWIALKSGKPVASGEPAPAAAAEGRKPGS